MTDHKTECEKTFYKKFYQFQDDEKSIVLDETTGRIYLLKSLRNYNIEVFRALKENHNPHIPVIYEYREEDSVLYVLEEYISGETLDSYLEHNSISEEAKINILSDLCDALSFLHGMKPPVIHRDIKMSNIMITNDGVVKVIDYDAAKVYHKGLERDTVLIGTIGIAAPEQYGFRQSDARTDVYAMSNLIQEMFPDRSGYKRIIRKASELNPKDRYQTIKQLKSALLRARIRRRLLPVPGFRSGVGWKMILACLGYSIIIYLCMKTYPAGQPLPPRIWWDRFCTLSMYLSLVDLFTHYSGIYDYFPLMKTRNPLSRIAGYCFLSMMIKSFWAFLAVFSKPR